MLNTQFTTIRELQRNYKKLGDTVNKTNEPFIILSKNKPQFAVVSLQMLEEMTEKNKKNSVQALLDLAAWAKKHKIRGPKDLSVNHDKYTWEE